MGKILIFVRASTEKQEIDDQKKEMQDFVKSMGYNEGDCVYLEDKGASAIKLNDKYLNMVEVLKEHIKGGAIECCAVWHMNRLGRNDEVLIELKNLFIKHKIQFICKNPSIVLLNPDGTVNEGAELAFGLFATMVKQDMIEKKAKFKRAKSAMAKKGQWVGGRTLKFGYKVDENKFFVEDENDGAIVKLSFQLYSTGEYSAESLAQELNDRGYKRNDGLPINTYFMVRLLKSKSYTGLPDEENNMRVYPPLISKELYDKCRGVADSNRIEMRKGERIVLGAKLLKCGECGSVFTSNSRHFGCCRAMHKRCNNNLKIRQCVVDDILWRVAFPHHIQFLIDFNEGKIETYREEVKIIEQKISTFMDKLSSVEAKKKRIIDTYLEGLIDKNKRDLSLSKLKDDTEVHQREINALEEKREAILGLIETASSELEEIDINDPLDIMELAEKDKQAKYNIIHKYVLKVIPSRMSFGIRDPRTTRDNGVLFTIYMVNGAELKYLFIPKCYKGHNLYIWNGNEWVADMVEITDNVYVRKEKKEAN